MNLRKVVFWLHLAAGVIAGIVIGIMSFTGVMLAYEKQLIAWAERDARRVTPPADAKALSLEDLLAKANGSLPGARPTAITLEADPGLAVLLSFGRTNSLYVNPYTGEVREPGAKAMRAFMHVMIDWHRYLGAHGDHRPLGKAVTGACNAAFLVLAVTGLYLWWPRQWTRRALAAVAVPTFRLRGKARDWNWHNAFGLWSAPVLIVLTATAMPISYRWAGNLIYTLTGTEAPAAGAPSGPPVEVPAPPASSRPLALAALIESAQREIPRWQQITVRPGGGGGGGRAGGPAGEARREGGGPAGQGGAERARGEGGAQAVTISVKERDAWPRFAAVQLSLDPYTGAVLRREDFSDLNAGTRVRRWTRFLHTGEALGLAGQGVASLASLAGVVLVWTGFALAWRRLLAWRGRRSASGSAEVSAPATAPVAVGEAADRP